METPTSYHILRCELAQMWQCFVVWLQHTEVGCSKDSYVDSKQLPGLIDEQNLQFHSVYWMNSLCWENNIRTLLHNKIWMNVVKMLIRDQSLKAASYWLQKRTVILPKDVRIQYTAQTLQSKHTAVKTALYGFMNSFYQPFLWNVHLVCISLW